ncbi:MAG: ECF-type sigma factor [Myxococcota bacterium]
MTSTTELLRRVASGDAEAVEAVMPSLYDDLHRIAQQQRRRWRGEPDLQTTALLHEAWLKVSAHRGAGWADRQHFFAVCTQAMRQILLNRARARLTAKRGGGVAHSSLDGVRDLSVQDAESILSVSTAVDELRARSERMADITEHRVFGGFSVAEIAEMMDVSARTVKRDWQRARAWLALSLGEEAPWRADLPS